MMGDIKWHKKIAWGLLTALSHFCFKMVLWLTFDLINEYKISLTFPQGISKHSLCIRYTIDNEVLNTLSLQSLCHHPPWECIRDIIKNKTRINMYTPHGATIGLTETWGMRKTHLVTCIFRPTHNPQECACARGRAPFLVGGWMDLDSSWHT